MPEPHQRPTDAKYRLKNDHSIPPRRGTVPAGTEVTVVEDGWDCGPYLERITTDDGPGFIVDVTEIEPADGQQVLETTVEPIETTQPSTRGGGH